MSFGASVVLIKSSSRFHRVGIECVPNLSAGSACFSDSVEIPSGDCYFFRACAVSALEFIALPHDNFEVLPFSYGSISSALW